MSNPVTRLLAVATLATLVFGAGPALAEEAQVRLRLKAASFDPVRGLPEAAAELKLETEPDAGYFIVQFDRDVEPGLLDQLRRHGATPLQYVPDRGYLVRVATHRAGAVRGLPAVRWLGAMEPAWKLSPELGLDGGDSVRSVIELFPDETAAPVVQTLEAAGVEVLETLEAGGTRRVRAEGTLAQMRQAARIPSVAWIEEEGELTHRNNTARWVVQSGQQNLTSVWDRGLFGEGQIIGHIDGRIDMNSCYFRDPIDNTVGPNHRKVIAYHSNSGLGANSHGTHTAGTTAGDQLPVSGTTSNNGLAYLAKIAHTNDADVNGGNLYSRLLISHQDGARVHTNSWGDDSTTAYTAWSRDIDSFSYDYEDSLVLFAATNLGNLRAPENAKNVLAVGASQNGFSADSFCSGGAGPTNDGRRKPEIFAPGCSIVSARDNNSCSTRTNSGTSMACPAVAAAGALVREYFVKGYYPTGTPQIGDMTTPSGALLKSVLLNSTRNMANISGYPSNQEGWGRLLMEDALYFPGDTRTLVVLGDVRNVDGLNTSDTAPHTLVVADDDHDLRITLVFTEPAAAVQANPATVNNLDLEAISPTGTVYRGNVFSGGVSVPGGSADPINNVENLVIPSPETGEWLITVHGTAVNQGTQGYALVATGQVAPGGGGLMRYEAHAVVDDAPLGNGNGRADPGETFTMPLTVRNLLITPATGIASVLNSTTSGVVVTRAAAAFPDLGVNQADISLPPHHEVTLAPDVPCFTQLVFDTAVSHDDGGNPFPFQVEVGSQQPVIDPGDVPKALPDRGLEQSTLDVSEPILIDNVRVAVHIAHGDIGELRVRLISPGGTNVTLHGITGSGVSDLIGTYDDDLIADGPGSMDDFDGEDAQGTWTLSVQDRTSSAVPPGTLVDWSLIIDPVGGGICTPLDCAGDPVPGAVDPTFLVDLEAGDLDVRFDWDTVPSASEYRIWRSTTPDFALPEILATTSGTLHIEPNYAVGPPIEYYRVRALNSCNWEGP